MELDQQLIFSEHAHYVKSKVIGKIQLLSRIRHKIDQETASMLYKSLIILNFDHSDYVYDCMNQRDILLLQRLQNLALKNILGVGKLTPTAL